MTYAATIVADSVPPGGGTRLTTFEVTFPRYVLAEVNTHRILARNSASSRAIPVRKRIEVIRERPVIPEFGRNQRGMQADENLEGREADLARSYWLSARDSAVYWAEKLADLEVHKQVANRILEPFAWHTAIITADCWGNFFDQRATAHSPLADPALRGAVDLMLETYEDSAPVERDLHLPFWADQGGHADDPVDLKRLGIEQGWSEGGHVDAVKRISSARCARVSYLTQHGTRDLTEDLSLSERLRSARPAHASPWEHVAWPCGCMEYEAVPRRGQVLPNPRIVRPDHRGCFVGWDQYRHEVEDALGVWSYR